MTSREFSSFRDPSGVVFSRDGVLYRQVNPAYIPTFRKIYDSGLYDALIERRLMIPHKAVDIEPLDNPEAIVIKPKRIPYISYPYEWSFGQYKAAALTTLNLQLAALEHGMLLKDASAYNIQFVDGYAVLMDTLSFEEYVDGRPWSAYGQFCRHFVAPLLLMSKVDVRLSKLMQSHIDGIPLDLADTLLGARGGFFKYQHIRLHARATAKHGVDGQNESRRGITSIGKSSLTAMINALAEGVSKLKLKDFITEWGDYYRRTNYTPDAANEKETIVARYLAEIAPFDSAWDFGANDGTYTRIALKYGKHAVAFDIDHEAVERNFTAVSKSHESMLPLLLDLTAPSPSIGFANAERVSIDRRGRPDVLMILAVVHHLAISNNLPLGMIAEWTSRLCRNLIIEFVPKEDSQVKILLATRQDIFPQYNEHDFERLFLEHFTLTGKQTISGSKRTLYLLKSKHP